VGVFNIVKGGQLDLSLYKYKLIEKSVKSLIFRDIREISVNHCPGRQIAPFKMTIINEAKQVDEFYQMLSQYSLNSQDYFNGDSIYKAPPAINLTTLNQNIRSAFTCTQLIRQVEIAAVPDAERHDQNVICKMNDLNEMSAGVRVFASQLQDFENL